MNTMKTDILIIGAGPAGIFTALELLRRGYKGHITMVEKGHRVEKRHCPKTETGKCMNCKPYCHITTGFSGAGAFSDGKLSLSYEVGGDLPTLVGEELAQQTIDYADGIYLEFGADTHVEGVSDPDRVKDIRLRAIGAGLKLVDCPIRHMGTEKAQEIYLGIEKYLEENGVELIPENKVISFTDDGVEIEDRNWNHRILKADTVVAAFGTVSNYPAVEHLSGLVPETYVVGDCGVPGNIKAANTSAYLLAARV